MSASLRTTRPAVGVAVAVAVAVASPAAARQRTLELSPRTDGIVLGVSLAGWAVPEFAKSAFAPDACRWCHRRPDGSVGVNGLDRGGRRAFEGLFGVAPPTWARTTDLLAFGVVPAAALTTEFFLASEGRPDAALGTDLLVLAQALALCGIVNQAFKFPFGRERPFVAYDSPWADRGLRHGTETSADDNLSFYSGHAALSMSTAVATARILDLRTGRRLGYYTLIPLSVVVAVGRMAADKHWATDVLAGMAAGAAIGWIVPTLHARP